MDGSVIFTVDDVLAFLLQLEAPSLMESRIDLVSSEEVLLRFEGMGICSFFLKIFMGLSVFGLKLFF